MSEVLEVAGTIAAAAFAAAGLLAPSPRVRLVALAAALVISVALVAGQAWDGPLAGIHESAPKLIGALAVAATGLAILTAAFVRWPAALPLAALAALPFRIPVDAGRESSNLLVPLYAVIVAGIAAAFISSLRPASGEAAAVGAPKRLRVPRPLALALAAAVLLYGIQAAYSEDAAFAARNAGFFLVPFAALFVLLASVDWTPRLLGGALAVVGASALAFAGIGIAQHLTETIFWNDSFSASNDFHFYFRVNSLFWDPNIYGRYLALALVLLLACLMWTRERRSVIALTAALAVIWVGLLFAFSQSSFIALLVGVAVLGALRWSWKGSLAVSVVCALAIVGAVYAFAGVSDSASTARDAAADLTEGRTTLVKGGLDLFGDRPLEGYGSASFSDAFGAAEDIPEGRTTISHNEPVTVAAEQGLVGLAVYLALIAASLWTLLAGMRSIAPGLGGPADGIGDPARSAAGAARLARVALLAAFLALLVHTIGYAGYLTDPLTWAMLAVGGALAFPVAGRGPAPTERSSVRAGADA
ncbi:MAG: O-antigen ligase domain-containing protein [Solirubrobacterales bacterium]|nr:O-antigen ligase domain-containing protein [Solirubrobacterales bacterium]